MLADLRAKCTPNSAELKSLKHCRAASSATGVREGSCFSLFLAIPFIHPKTIGPCSQRGPSELPPDPVEGPQSPRSFREPRGPQGLSKDVPMGFQDPPAKLHHFSYYLQKLQYLKKQPFLVVIFFE